MSKNTTDEQMKHYNKIIEQFDSVHMPAKQREIIMTEIEQLISNREKLAYRSGYAAGNAKKNYRKKVDAETVEQLKTEITADVLSTLRKELDGGSDDTTL